MAAILPVMGGASWPEQVPFRGESKEQLLGSKSGHPVGGGPDTEKAPAEKPRTRQ